MSTNQEFKFLFTSSKNAWPPMQVLLYGWIAKRLWSTSLFQLVLFIYRSRNVTTTCYKFAYRRNYGGLLIFFSINRIDNLTWVIIHANLTHVRLAWIITHVRLSILLMAKKSILNHRNFACMYYHETHQSLLLYFCGAIALLFYIINSWAVRECLEKLNYFSCWTGYLIRSLCSLLRF